MRDFNRGTGRTTRFIGRVIDAIKGGKKPYLIVSSNKHGWMISDELESRGFTNGFRIYTVDDKIIQWPYMTIPGADPSDPVLIEHYAFEILAGNALEQWIDDNQLEKEA